MELNAKAKIIIIAVINLGFPSFCLSQKIMHSLYDSLITPTFEKIDSNILFFKKKHPNGKYKSANGDTIILNNQFTIRDRKFNITKSIVFYASFDLNGDPRLIYEFSEVFSPYLAIRKTFYWNGNIHRKIISSWLGFAVGKGYWFNEKGKVIKTENFEKHYRFNFNDVLEFCRNNNISLERNEKGSNPTVQRMKYLGRPSWFITATYPKINKWVIIVLDGKTGELKGILPALVYLE